MTQRIESLKETDWLGIQAHHKWVRGHLTPESQHLFDDWGHKLRVIDAILKEKWIEPGENLKFLCLGTVLGEALMQYCNLEWVVVDDETGRSLGLRAPGTSLILFPVTMISKRVERGEEVDVYDLFKRVAVSVHEFVQSGEYDEVSEGSRNP